MAKSDSENDKTGNALSNTLKIAAYPLSGTVGYSYIKHDIRNAVYEDLKEHGAFKDFRPQYHAQLNDVIERFHAGKTADVLRETVAIHDGYKNRLTARFSEMGLGSLGKQWQFVHQGQRQNALITGFTAAGVSLGVLLTVANSKTLSALTNRQDEDRAQERQR